MSSSFRSRIFRLLLLFSVVPSILLTLLGYYLVFDSDPTSTREESGSEDPLSGYLSEMLYRDITDALNRHTDTNQASLDFLLRADTDAETTVNSSGLDQDVATRLQAAAGLHQRGLIAVGNDYYQYVARPNSAGRLLIGGIVHDSGFAAMMETARQRSATRSARRELRSTYLAFLGLLLLSVTAIGIIAAYFFSSRVSRHLAEPVMALSHASQGIASGDFSQRVTAGAEGEIGRLIASFNRMAAQLDQTTSRLAQTERVAAWRQVARRFAHELKNPLQPILVSLYRLEQQLSETALWDQVKEPLQAAREEVQHLTLLAERFSALAKLPPPKVELLNLTDLTGSVVELYQDKLRPFRFALNFPDNTVSTESDAAYIREALHNLLQNSIDACQPGDRITVTVTAATDTIALSVSDTGAGMDEPTLSSARLPYFTTKKKGNGLGLAIVERSMAELGGQLRVESQKDRGTTVTILLPRKKT